jgi:hypothetical protein
MLDAYRGRFGRVVATHSHHRQLLLHHIGNVPASVA